MTETQGSRGEIHILDRIVATKREEVAELRRREAELEAALAGAPEARDLAGALRAPGGVAVMAEVKRRSPGAGEIRPGLDPVEVARGYEEAGAAAVSVLTDRSYFGGSLEDLARVRRAVGLPVLRKDFTVDELQVVEARGAGADAVLLIVRILDDAELRDLAAAAADLGMAALVEVHDRRELERALAAGATLLGINNRNLDTFETRLDVTEELLPLVPPTVTVVSESGIGGPDDVDRVGRAGAHAVLVGESLLRAESPARATTELVGRRP